MPVSSATSRRTPASKVSSSSRTPPGGSQRALSRRCTARMHPSSRTTIPATLTECFGVAVIELPLTGAGVRRLLLVWTTEGVESVQLGAIDRTSDRPPYRQIADHLRAAIAAGSLRPGDQLPSETELKTHYGVARMTAR